MTVNVDPTRPGALIPENAPFTPEQREWLNGFFAAVLSPVPAATPGDLPPLPASADPAFRNPLDDGDDGESPWHDPAMPITERMTLAEGRPVRRRLMAAMAQQDCGQCGYNCEDYSNAIAMQAEGRLNLCVPGGKETARMLKTLIPALGGGATGPEDEKARADARIVNAEVAELKQGYSRAAPALATFLGSTRLNREGSEKETFHIEFDLAGTGIDYVVGDSFGVYATNHPDLVTQIMDTLGFPDDFPIADRTLREVLTEDVALGAAPDMLFEFVSYLVGGERRAKAKALAKGEDPDGDAATLDVLGALLKFPGIRPDPEAFIESLEPLQPRLYSISSSPKSELNKLSLTVDHVNYVTEGRKRYGVASNFLSNRMEPGTQLKVYLQKAHNFALPDDTTVPVIMVGPGTGVAPFRAFLHERMATKATGGAWLFYGHQRQAQDFFYEDEFAGMTAQGALTKLSLAWSRDVGPKTYVQDRMREEGADLWAWLQRGAHFYVCGDAKRMAADVEKAVVAVAQGQGGMDEAAARTFVADLKKTGRYQADVY